MAKNLQIVRYSDEYKEKWDRFVLDESVNGTFLQTMNFLEYHPSGRFDDNSLMFMNGNNIVAVIPANCVEDGGKVLYSHQGSTFGGIIVGKGYQSIAYMDLIFAYLDKYLKENEFKKIILKQTGSIYQTHSAELIDYYLFLNGYTCSMELGYYIDYDVYESEIISNYNGSRRRGYRHSLKNEFTFRLLESELEIEEFYDVLCDNYTKFGYLPVHTAEELCEFKRTRLTDIIVFYGVYYQGRMIAGSMTFNFGDTLHTQYLAARQEQTNLYVNEFMYTKLIETARQAGFKRLSFGTSTLEHGKVLNHSLAEFKEGFGTKEYINYTYTKELLI